MTIRSSRYFNNPQIAQAYNSLASAFAPPDGNEAAAWARAGLRKQQMDQIAELFGSTSDPSARAALIGVQGYGQTPGGFTYKVDQDNAVARRGQDITAQTSRANNADTVRGGVLGKLYEPLNPGQVRPEVPAGIAGIVGLPALPSVAGAPKPSEPPSETQWWAQEAARLRQSGRLSEQMILDTILGDKAPVQAVGPAGKPVFMSPGAAVREGAQPYEKPWGANLDGDNYLGVTADGRETRFVGRPDGSGRIVDINSGQPFAGQILRREGTSGGMSVEVGKDGTFRMVTGNGAGQTTSRVTDLQRQEAETGRAVNELTSLFDVLRTDDLGAAGNINELLTNYGAQMFPGLARPDVAATRAQLNATTLGLARALVQDERLSDADREAANAVAVSNGLGESLPGAQAKLASLIALNAYRQRYANTVRTGGDRLPPLDAAMLGRLVDDGAVSPRVADVYVRSVLARRPQAQSSPIPGVNIPRSMPPMAGQSGSDLPTVSTPQEAAALPSGTRFRDPNGNIRRVP